MALAVSLAAQEQPTGIIGVIKDPSGGVLPGVIVTLSGGTLRRPIPVGTATNGTFQLDAVPDGSYTVTMELAGFKRVTRKITIAGRERVDLGVTTLEFNFGSEPSLAEMGLKPDDSPVAFSTSLGVFSVAIDRKLAPSAADAFLKHVDAHFFDGGRIVPASRADTPPGVSGLPWVRLLGPATNDDSFAVRLTKTDLLPDSGGLAFGRVWHWRERADVVSLIFAAPRRDGDFSPSVTIIRANGVILLMAPSGDR